MDKLKQAFDQVGNFDRLSNNLCREFTRLRGDMNERFASFDHRFSSIEHHLDSYLEENNREEIIIRFFDFIFNAAFLVFGISIASFLVRIHLHF